MDVLIIKIAIRTKINSSEIPYSNRKLKAATIAPDKDNKISAILLTWRPGKSPVAIPVITPRMQNKITRRRGSIVIAHY